MPFKLVNLNHLFNEEVELLEKTFKEMDNFPEVEYSITPAHKQHVRCYRLHLDFRSRSDIHKSFLEKKSCYELHIKLALEKIDEVLKDGSCHVIVSFDINHQQILKPFLFERTSSSTQKRHILDSTPNYYLPL